ncbi:patatin-like phospholipase family protein [Novosphingobium panipatense]
MDTGSERFASDGSGRDLEDIRRSFAAMMTLAAGRPGVFVPRYFSWLTPGLSLSEQVSLHDTLPLRAELERLLDFDLLNAPSAPAFLATAIDIETGEDVAFDSRRQPVHADHLRASAALLPAFAPVEIDGRLFGDPGMSANLPLDCALHEPGDGPLLCFALDLLPLHGRRPGRLSESVLRMQDLCSLRRAVAPSLPGRPSLTNAQSKAKDGRSPLSTSLTATRTRK